jgi:hypothetical protein
LKKTQHYVNNADFLAALKLYKIECNKAKAKKKESPAIPEFVGECFLMIAQRLSFKPNFVNYTFRDDMISDGVENCLQYVQNFDPSKSSNPFGYFTQVIWFAFIRRIQREKRQTYIRYKLMEQAVIDGGTHEKAIDGGNINVDGNMLSFDNVKEFLVNYDAHATKRRERRRQAKTPA